MKKRLFFKFFAFLIGAANALLWEGFLISMAFAAGANGSKGDFGHNWISWTLAHPIISILWGCFGAYSLILSFKLLVKLEKEDKQAL